MKYVIRLCGATMVALTVSIAAASPAGPNYQGLWWNAPAESEAGWGINFAHQGDVIFATWFTYDANGRAWWLTMTAEKTGPNTYAGKLYETRGPAFNAMPFDPAGVQVIEVGDGTLTFSDTNNGTFRYTVNGVTQTKTLVRQVFGPLAICTFGAQPNLALATNYQDLWWVPDGVESGWGVNFTHQGDIIFATWFTYDADGAPLWLSATVNKTAPGVYTGTLYRTTGPAFNAVPFLPASVGLTAVGSLTLAFADGNSAAFLYTVNGVTQTKQIARQVFRTPGTVCQAASDGVLTAEGLWSGTTSHNQTVRAIILDDGTYYILYSIGDRTVAGVVQGSSSAENGKLASSDGLDFFIGAGSLIPATVSGTYVPRSSLQLTIAEASGPRTLAASYDVGYERPANLAAAAGTYTGVTGHITGNKVASFSLDSGGTLWGANDICQFQGTVTPRKSVNVFDWTVIGAGACIFGSGPISGLMYYDEANRQLLGFSPFAARSDLWYLIGTK